MPEPFVLLFHLRASRKKAVAIARAEALALLDGLGARTLSGGPLSEQGGVFWISCPAETLELAAARLTLLGYSEAVDVLEPAGVSLPISPPSPPRRCPVIRWRSREYRQVRLYEENPEGARMAAPDQRIFRYQDRSGVIRDVKGYRGDGDALSRRGLPVCDASMLVNLTIPPPGGRLLDPFAGIGGIIIPAARRGLEVYSMDLDPALRHGLSAIAAGHAVADAGQMPIEGCSIDAVATEPPYHPEADESVERAMAEIARVLRPGARAAVLCAARQAGFLRASAANVGMIAGIDAELNRKGLDVTLLTWVKLDRPEL